MRIKTKKSKPFKGYLLAICVTAIALKSYSQINEATQTTVYDYLYRMSQKGLISWKDYQLPLDRKAIFNALRGLSIQQDELSGIEELELRFYLKEYAFDSLHSSQEKRYYILKNDSAGRFRTALYEKDDARLFLDPVFGVQQLASNGKHNLHYFTGVRIAGYFGKHWGVNFYFRENTEKGDTINRRPAFVPAEGIVPTIETERLVNYSNINFNIGYRWKNGAFTAGKDNLTWGYGLGGNIILSGKAPSYPYIKLDYQPWKWLHFNYFHGWLHSNIIDSARSYNTGTGLFEGKREIYRSKFLAHHSIIITPVKGLDVSIGESIVYSDRLHIAYLIPINFFRAYDHYQSRYNITAGDNSQFFGMISSRNHLKKTHLYAQLFIDEIRASKVFNKKQRRNQLGYTLGINRTDLFIHYLTAGLEYSRINPFVYNNLVPAQTYESHGYNLGDWMGNNADRLYAFVHYTPLPRLKIRLWRQYIRKGGPGTLEQQYFQLPQPPFLFDKRFDFKETGASLAYEWINRLRVFAEANKVTVSYVNGPTDNNTGLRLGFSYGL